MWEFTDIRERAIQELSKEEISMGTMEKIECGKAYEVKEWLLDGYIELLKRPETITEEEAERLGWKTAAKLLLLREQYLSTISSTFAGQLCGRCNERCGGTFYRQCRIYSVTHQCAQQFALPDRNQYDFATAVQKELDAGL
jgi:hypothetical protein